MKASWAFLWLAFALAAGLCGRGDMGGVLALLVLLRLALITLALRVLLVPETPTQSPFRLCWLPSLVRGTPRACREPGVEM